MDNQQKALARYRLRVLAYSMIDKGFLNEYTVGLRARLSVYRALDIV